MRDAIRRWLASGYAWLFAAALLLRWVYLAEALRRNELLTFPVVDARVYVDWAHDILAGHWLWHETKTYTPGIPLWLAGWFALLGERPAVHFAIFQFLGALQAVVLGKTAEIFWGRRAGLATGWFAALYWPLILFEATYYAEPFAILNLSLTLYLLARWSRSDGGWRWLLLAGLCLGGSILARANAMLCAPVFAAWVAWHAARTGWPCAAKAVCCLMLGPAVLCLPIVAWNWKVTGVAELRTGGWLSAYLGNNPEYRGLVVPVGARWGDFVYQPIRAGKIERVEQNDYWRESVFRIVREETGAWAQLMARKALMLVGRTEVSQEIDIGTFRRSSRVLSLPLWPGWGALLPLALVGSVALLRSRDTRRDGLLLVLCAAAYLVSIAPVQVAGRYRLPAVVPLLPIAGWAAAQLVEMLRRRDWPRIIPAAALAGAAAFLAWPDWLGLAREKIINHSFLIGLKRESADDLDGALAAFAAGSAWNPQDPDCPLTAGGIELRRGAIAAAEAHFTRTLEIFPRSHNALLGLGECALANGHPEEALRRVGEALRLAPNHLDALGLAAKACTAQHNWPAVAATCAQMRTHPVHPASVEFTEARALTLAGRAAEAMDLYDAVAGKPWHSEVERARATFLAGTLAWRLPGRRAQAAARWRQLAAGPPGLFQLLGQLLAGEITPDALRAALLDSAEPHVAYALAMAAIQRGQSDEAVRQLTVIASRRDAAHLPEEQRELLEIWALEDLRRAPSRPAANGPAIAVPR
jgi:tetratricopeptide (TPR) repeat protein